MFIVLEGLDGAGKSTQMELLKNHLESKGERCRFIHFPRYDAPVFGELIGRFLRGEFGDVGQVDPYLVALLYAGDRADAAQEIRQLLAQGVTVIADRYVYSNVGYQCAKIADKDKRQRLKEWIMQTEYGHFNLPQPDRSIFLDVPFAFTERKLSALREGSDRDYLNGQRDIHEKSLSLQATVREVYLEAAKSDTDLSVVDCSDEQGGMATPETIFSRLLAQLK